ncbi:TAT-binding protein-like protein 7, AAA ATPase [Tieghemiomyces parasiticus]|uniref:TAT-binding protein-like protein 7, AAA ATPase n=1 Tax=Tieghemiomyces parasiticus TaxID=78921 RepID=A0A9W8AJ02_9FUNG|nr:TAT-binding protein-like protein 7, AAA ATPase [Tieghemiomyces parasiticus]
MVRPSDQPDSSSSLSDLSEHDSLSSSDGMSPPHRSDVSYRRVSRMTGRRTALTTPLAVESDSEDYGDDLITASPLPSRLQRPLRNGVGLSLPPRFGGPNPFYMTTRKRTSDAIRPAEEGATARGNEDRPATVTGRPPLKQRRVIASSPVASDTALRSPSPASILSRRANSPTGQTLRSHHHPSQRRRAGENDEKELPPTAPITSPTRYSLRSHRAQNRGTPPVSAMADRSDDHRSDIDMAAHVPSNQANPDDPSAGDINDDDDDNFAERSARSEDADDHRSGQDWHSEDEVASPGHVATPATTLDGSELGGPDDGDGRPRLRPRRKAVTYDERNVLRLSTTADTSRSKRSAVAATTPGRRDQRRRKLVKRGSRNTAPASAKSADGYQLRRRARPVNYALVADPPATEFDTAVTDHQRDPAVYPGRYSHGNRSPQGANGHVAYGLRSRGRRADDDDDDYGNSDSRLSTYHAIPPRDCSRSTAPFPDLPPETQNTGPSGTYANLLRRLGAPRPRRPSASIHDSRPRADSDPDPPSSLPVPANLHSLGRVRPPDALVGTPGRPLATIPPTPRRAAGGGPNADAAADADPLQGAPTATFADVGGLDHYVRSLKEMVMLPLLYPELYAQFGISPPRGVLFHGPPGTGKTLMARALAHSCSTDTQSVAFFMRKGADCLSKWVGETERQLRVLFEQARAWQPSIIFFDEIDGIAPVRSSKADQTHASIVSTLLALMDGLDGRGQVVVIGATNRIDAVDPALRRPGRFDREFYFPLPNAAARRAILGLATVPWVPPVPATDLDALVQRTKGYCGADLKALCTEAALHAIRHRYPQIYGSTDKLVVDPTMVTVGPADFAHALRHIVPAAHRVAGVAAAELPPVLRPLLQPVLERALQALHPQVGHVSTRGGITARPALGWPAPTTSGPSAAAGLPHLPSAVLAILGDGGDPTVASPSLEGTPVFRPRLLLTGRPGLGQDRTAAAILSSLEDWHVVSLDLSKLVGDDAQHPEVACARAVVEARRHTPSVLYLPDAVFWWDTVSDTASRTLIHALLTLIGPHEPVLVLGYAQCTWDAVPDDLRRLFITTSGVDPVASVLSLEPPAANQRVAFFASLLTDLRRPVPPHPALASIDTNGDGPPPSPLLEFAPLPKAPPPEPRKLTASEQQALQDHDDYVFRQLRLLLRSLLEGCIKDRKFKGLQRLTDEDHPAATLHLRCPRPLDLGRLTDHINAHYYLTPTDFLGDVDTLVANVLHVHGPTSATAKRAGMVDRSLVDRAYAFQDHMHALMDTSLNPELAQECERSAARRLEMVKEQLREQGRRGENKVGRPKGPNKVNGLATLQGAGTTTAAAPLDDDTPAGRLRSGRTRLPLASTPTSPPAQRSSGFRRRLQFSPSIPTEPEESPPRPASSTPPPNGLGPISEGAEKSPSPTSSRSGQRSIADPLLSRSSPGTATQNGSGPSTNSQSETVPMENVTATPASPLAATATVDEAALDRLAHLLMSTTDNFTVDELDHLRVTLLQRIGYT